MPLALARWADIGLAGALVVVAAAHIPVTPPHLSQAPYMGVLFLLLTISSGGLALLVLVSARLMWRRLAALLALGALVGYALTRLVSFPLLSDDVGHWAEPLGVISIVAEAVVVATAVVAIRAAGAPPIPVYGP